MPGIALNGQQGVDFCLAIPPDDCHSFAQNGLPALPRPLVGSEGGLVLKKSTPPSICKRYFGISAARSGDATCHLTHASEVLGANRKTFTRSGLFRVWTQSAHRPPNLIIIAGVACSRISRLSQGGELRPRDLGMDPSAEATVGTGNDVLPPHCLGNR